MEIQVTQADGVTVIEPTGEIDSRAADQVKRTFTELIEGSRSKLLVDLTAVPYIDSTGLGVLVAAMKQARAAGGDVRLCGLQKEVLSVLVITHLTKVIAVYESRQEAISSW